MGNPPGIEVGRLRPELTSSTDGAGSSYPLPPGSSHEAGRITPSAEEDEGQDGGRAAGVRPSVGRAPGPGGRGMTKPITRPACAVTSSSTSGAALRELSRTVAQPPGNTSYHVRMVSVPSIGRRSKRRAPGTSADDLGRAGDVTRIGEAQVDRLRAGAVVIDGDRRSPVVDGQQSGTTNPRAGRPRTGRAAAVGTAWACSHIGSISLAEGVDVHRGAGGVRVAEQPGRVEQRAGSTRIAVTSATTTRRNVHRCTLIGRGRSGSRRRNSSWRSRPSARSARRSCEGRARPRAAANASDISSTVNCRSARS